MLRVVRSFYFVVFARRSLKSAGMVTRTQQLGLILLLGALVLYVIWRTQAS
jgi:hypothetical protein